MTMKTDDPAADAAVAARNAERKNRDIPNVVLGGQPIGECSDCGARFDYNNPDDDVHGLDDCPKCASGMWYNWGYRYNGEEIRRDRAWGKKSPPPGHREGSQAGDGDE